jgi:hypothetical protein
MTSALVGRTLSPSCSFVLMMKTRSSGGHTLDSVAHAVGSLGRSRPRQLSYGAAFSLMSAQ